MNHILSEKRRELLLFGYIRQNKWIFIPSDIYRLFWIFYSSDIVKLNIDITDLKTINKSHDDEIHRRIPFCIDNIDFCVSLTLKKEEKDEYYINYIVTIVGIPPYIHHITLFVRLYCKQIYTEYKDIQIINNNGHNIQWPKNTLIMDKNNDINSLSFGCDIDILRITHCSYYYKSITMTETTIIECCMDKQMLITLMEFDKPFYSDNIDENWCIRIVPYRKDPKYDSNKKLRGKYQIALMLLSMPKDIKLIKINAVWKNLSNKNNETITKDFTFHDNCTILPIHSIAKPKKLCFNIKIKIIDVYTNQLNKKINNKYWYKYNIKKNKIKHLYQYNNKIYNNYIASKKKINLKWIIKGEQFKKFKLCKKGKLFTSKPLKIGNIRFKADIYPNGIPNKSASFGFIEFYLILTHLPCFIKHIVVYYRLYCKQSEESEYSQFKDIKRMNKIGHGIKWPSSTLSINDINDINDNNLQFGVDLNIIQIAYKNNPINPYYFSPLSMQNEIKFKWNINNNLYSKFKNAKYGQLFHSKSFSNWCIDCYPNGFNEAEAGNLRLSLVLLGLPPEIKMLKINIKLKAILLNKNKSIQFSNEYKFSYDQKVYGWPSGTFLTQWLHENDNDNNNQNENKLYFVVSIKILKVYNIWSQKILPHHWCNYAVFKGGVNNNNNNNNNDNNSNIFGELLWIIRDNELNRFYRCKNCQRFGQKSFNINNIEFGVKLYSNGDRTTNVGAILFFLYVPILPPHIDNIKVYIHLYCKQVLAEFKCIKIFERLKSEQSWGWNSNTLRLSECVNKLKLNNNNNNNNDNELEFGCFIEILRINYNNTFYLNKPCNIFNAEIRDYYKPLITFKNLKFIWCISSSLLLLFISSRSRRVFYTDDFANCWILSCVPNGAHDADIGHLRLWLWLIRLPPFISCITAHVILESNCDNIKVQGQRIFGCQGGDLLGWPAGTFLKQWLEQYNNQNNENENNLQFMVTISILEIKDIHGNKIQHDNWKKFGIYNQPYNKIYDQCDIQS